MGALHWASIPLSDAGWYLTNYNTQSIQFLLELLKEMAYLHVYQRSEILKLLKKCFELDTELDPLASLDIKKKVLDAIIYLMECGFTMPVISTIEEWANQGIDQSLIRYFITKVLEMVGPPFSVAFLTKILRIINKLSERSVSVPEYKLILKPFLEHCIDANYELEPTDKEILHTLHSEASK